MSTNAGRNSREGDDGDEPKAMVLDVPGGGCFQLCNRWAYLSSLDLELQAGLFWKCPAKCCALPGRFWFAVLLIGVGYWILSRDVSRNRGIVWLGIIAKIFDVTVLSSRWADGVARPIVLVPAAVDAAFAVLFILFLLSGRGQPAR